MKCVHTLINCRSVREILEKFWRDNWAQFNKFFENSFPGSIFWILSYLKVSKSQNEFMKSSFLPKYEPNIVRISALFYLAEILTIFGSYFGRNDDFINAFCNLLTFRRGRNSHFKRNTIMYTANVSPVKSVGKPRVTRGYPITST